MSDLISRQAAIDALGDEPEVWSGKDEYELGLNNQWHYDVNALKALPSAKPERLTDDDFETIRIHLSAYKEKLCNQHRWEEAEEYQRIIDRFMAFASAELEIIRCKDCKYSSDDEYCHCSKVTWWTSENDFCSRAERRTDEPDR